MKILSIVLYLLLSACTTAPDPEWLVALKARREALVKQVPSDVAEALSKEHPDFAPLPLSDEAKMGIAVGDFNCDGVKDYAVTGLPKSHLLVGLVNSKKTDAATLEQARKELEKYRTDEAGEVRVALSTSKGFVWLKERGSYIENSGRNETGCAGSPSEENMKELKKDKCEFLSLGCCEKDSRYYIYKREGTEVRTTDGC